MTALTPANEAERLDLLQPCPVPNAPSMAVGEGERSPSLFMTMPLGVVYWDALGRVLDANPAAVRMLGLTPGQMQEHTAFDPRWRAVREDGAEFPWEERPAQVALRTGRAVRGVIMGISLPAQGETRWLRVEAVPEFLPGLPTPHRICAVFEDITESRRAEAEAQARARQIALILENTTDIFFALDRSWRYTYVNAQAERVAQTAREELLGRSIWDAFPQALGTVTEREYRRAMDERATVEFTEFIAEFGVWVELRAYPTEDGIAVYGRDVTERVRQEEALRQSHERLVESERRLRLALTGGWLGWWHRDLLTGRYLEFSEQCKAHFGLPLDGSFCHADIEDCIHPEDLAHVEAAARQAIEGRQEYAVEYRVVWPDGSVHWLNAHGVPLYDEAGQPVRIIGTTQEVTPRRLAQEVLRERTEVLENVLATIPHQVFWKDRDSVYLGCNTQFAHAAGLAAPDDVIGKRDDDLPLVAEHAEDYRRSDRRVIDEGQAVLDMEQAYRHPAGPKVGVTSKLPLHDAQGRVIGVLGITQDITERKTLETERERLLTETERLLGEARERADRDPLTNLLNHRAFHSRLQAEEARAACGGTTLAVAMLDLDNFKFFNDVYGHAVGDDVLRHVAERLQGACCAGDTLARFGGDEFALLLPDVAGATVAEVEARLRADLAGIGYRPAAQETTIPITLSIGVSLFPCGGQDRHEALRRADERLLRAKTGGAAETTADRVRANAAGSVAGFSMLDALVTAVDNKDRYTRRHSEGVLSYSLQIADGLGLDEKTRQTVAVAALLHDVGKIGVPDVILRKPGRLTDEEFEAVRQHPMMGAAIVSTVPGLEDTLDAIRHHHERWDGGGYPFGLRGEETPLVARLMAVADAFSAMTTDRPYRQGMRRDKALSILEAGAGLQWDPQCVAAFLGAQRTRRGD